MPIIINDENKVSNVDIKGNKKSLASTIYSPSFFNSQILTGKGGTSRGLLNENRDPKKFPNGYPERVSINLDPGHYYNKNIKIHNIPCYIINKSLWDDIQIINNPDVTSLTKIAEKNGAGIYLDMPIHTVVVDEEQIPATQNTTSSTTKTLSACFQMFLYKVNDTTDTTFTQTIQTRRTFLDDTTKNYFAQDIVYNMFTSLRSVEKDLTAHGYTVYKDVMNDFLQNYSLYTELCKSAEKWLTKMDTYIADMLIQNIYNSYPDPNDRIWYSDYSGFTVFETLSRLEKYNIPLDQYKNLYDKMKSILPDAILDELCRANLNLKLANTLRHMDANRNNLQYCNNINHVKSKVTFSPEQIDAIESTSPLTLVQSGAGTGKSTVILGRIDHMIANGIDPSDITVLSFTNAAADHITDLKPTIHSMTIASMLHTIYSANYPTHQLSSIATIINSLDIYFGNVAQRKNTNINSTFISDFKHILERLQNNNEYTRANNFVEANIDDVITVLDTIEQTSLELESIICYQKMDTLIEPDEVKTKHLIIDEVQDNSIAEFIYSIKYTDKHQCSMYIVGDCSQTLYEFRASNPKALNVLESSGVFTTYKLQTNYRSNQEILDFANIGLGNIEANQYANIQLKANSLKPVTLQSFKDAVQVQYMRMLNKSPQTVQNMLAHSIAVDAHNYINDKFAKNEQVCILAPARRTLWEIKSHIEKIYPGRKVVSLIPERQKDNDVFSKFIARYWDTISYTPPNNLIQTIRRSIFTNLQSLMYRVSQSNLAAIQIKMSKIMDDFENTYGSVILNWQNQVINSVMTQQELLDETKKLMLSFEIRNNSIAQALMSARNAKTKTSNDVTSADVILSTIHSAKGLEFDNVIIYYASESESKMDEATKRMYYVALTRARKTEFIFAYDTLARPKILGDYEKIIKDLEVKEKLTAANSNDDENDDEDITDIEDTPNIQLTERAIKGLNARKTATNVTDNDES